MSKQLRPYQCEMKEQIYEQWNQGHKNLLLTMDTGLGKTTVFCTIAKELAIDASYQTPTCIMVHRKELVSQISLTLAEEGIRHNLIAPKKVINEIIGYQRNQFNRQYYDYMAPITVVSVDTLNARIDKHEKWAKSIKLWITDEAHHVLKDNKWGRALSYFPNAFGLGVTATPERLDKKGLGDHADGVFHKIVLGPDSRWGISNEYLSTYKVAVPQSDYQEYLKSTGSGDYTKRQMAEASEKSHIVGDVVTEYKKHANGKQAIVFASDVHAASLMAKNFNSQGVKAQYLTGDTPDKERVQGVSDFKNAKTQVLINVDLFDEGFDVPGIEVVIMARPTKSVGKFKQMVGRGLRRFEGKDYLILIDHVGNIMGRHGHGLPDKRRTWTLDRIKKKQANDNFIRICRNPQCQSPYDRALTVCPWCGTEAISASSGEGGGNALEEVDGDLELLDPEVLRQIEEQASLEDPASVAERVAAAAGPAAGTSALRKQQDRIEAQQKLAGDIAGWAGEQKHLGYNDREIHKKFYLEFKKTISQALGLTKSEMDKVSEKLGGDDETQERTKDGA